jgi:hypothetical protein
MIRIYVAQSPVQSIFTLAPNANGVIPVFTRIDIDCSQPAQTPIVDGYTYPAGAVYPPGTVILLSTPGLGGNFPITPPTSSATPYITQNYNMLLTGVNGVVEVSFQGSAPAYGNCQISIFYRWPNS